MSLNEDCSKLSQGQFQSSFIERTGRKSIRAKKDRPIVSPSVANVDTTLTPTMLSHRYTSQKGAYDTDKVVKIKHGGSTTSSACFPSIMYQHQQSKETDDKENFITPVSNGKARHHKKHKRTASLTDLRPEDKKKVANLIQELANLGSEKERIETCLKTERTSFEEAIKDLVNDQKALLTERHAVQSELHSCQQMLSQLQEAVLHRPMSASLTSHGSEMDNNSRSIVLDNRQTDISRCSELETYITKHNAQDMDVSSELGSVTSESAKNPRTSSTLNDGRQQRSREMPTRLPDTSAQQFDSTIEYSKKDEIFAQRAKLVEEQRLLRQRLAEQEEMLRMTQQRLFLREHQLSERHYREKLLGQTFDVGSANLMDFTYSVRDAAMYPSEGNARERRSTPTNTCFNVGRKVAYGGQTSPVRHTQDHSAQTEMPIQSQSRREQPSDERQYIGNRLVPSPSSCTSRSQSSMQQTIEKTNHLLESARKVIEDAKSPRVATPHSKVTSQVTKSSSRCSHSYSIHTPCKASEQLFNSYDRSLATDINSTALESDTSEIEDRTELEMLEDIFYVK